MIRWEKTHFAPHSALSRSSRANAPLSINLSKKFKLIGVAVWLFASSFSLAAQVFEISPFYGYRFGGDAKTTTGYRY